MSDFVMTIVEFELNMNTAILLPNRNEIAGVSIGRNEHKNIQINNSILVYEYQFAIFIWKWSSN